MYFQRGLSGRRPSSGRTSGGEDKESGKRVALKDRVISGGGSSPAQLREQRLPTAPMPGLSSGVAWPRADHRPSLAHATQRGELIPATSDIPVAHLVTPGDVKLGCLKGMPKAKVSKPFA